VASVPEMLDPLVNVADVEESWRPSTDSVAVPLMLRVAAPPMVSCAAQAGLAAINIPAHKANDFLSHLPLVLLLEFTSLSILNLFWM
jgi:hypothetical protein